MLRPNADLGVKLGILDTAAGLWPQVAAFLLVTSPVATGALVWEARVRPVPPLALELVADFEGAVLCKSRPLTWDWCWPDTRDVFGLVALKPGMSGGAASVLPLGLPAPVEAPLEPCFTVVTSPLDVSDMLSVTGGPSCCCCCCGWRVAARFMMERKSIPAMLWMLSC